jgi:hypothetical protein
MAYPINAFGDHFLTDAFSAGHLINKEMVMNTFISNVITNNKINSKGDTMFRVVADTSLQDPEVRGKLARYELVETVRGKHWNLDTDIGLPEVRVFYELLKRIMEDTARGGRQLIANLAVKAVHEALNEYQDGNKPGVPVQNNKGHSWNLTGDGTLNLDNIKIIQLAVKTSVENIITAVFNQNTPLKDFYKMVWDYVPVLTHPATRAVVDQIVAIYTYPSSPQLVAKAVKLIKVGVDDLLKGLEERKIIMLDV